MVAPKPGESLLLYIAATTEAVSMVLVAKRPEPHRPQELGSSSASGSGFQGPEHAKEPRAGEATGSQLPKVFSAHETTGSQLPEVCSGPDDQAVTGSWTSEVPLDPEDRHPPAPEPMEIDAPWEGPDSLAPSVLH
jgi:hypothetical protein